MAIAYVASATADYTATTPAAQAVPLPSGWQAGDLLLLFVPQGVATNSTTVTWTGATQVGNPLGGSDQFTSLWWKIASSSESPTFSTSDASSRSSVVTAAYRGVDPTTPIDTTVGFVDSPAGTTHAVPSQTVTANAWLVSLASLDGSAGTAEPQYTPPSGWTERLDYNNNTTDNYASALADTGPLSAGTVSGATWTSVYADRAVNVTVVALREYVVVVADGYILLENGDRILSESGADLIVSEQYSPSASGTGVLSLSATASASAATSAAASLSLSAAASGVASTTGTGILSLSGAANISGGTAASGSGELSLSATGGAVSQSSGSGALSLSATAGVSASLSAATAALSLSATGTASSSSGAAVYVGATSVAQTGTAGTSSPSAAMPSGTQGGDLLLAFHGIGSSSDTVTFPAGWSTPVRETGATGVGDSFSWKVAAGTVGQATTEPALVVTSGANRNHVIVVLAFRVSDTVNPIVLSAHSPVTPASTSKTAPGGTASGDVWELNAIFDHPAGSTSSDSTWTVPSGFTVRGETNNVQNGSFGSSVVVATNDTNPTSTGSVPTRAWTTSLNVVGSAWSVALKSGGAPSAPTPTITYRVNGLARVRTKTSNATSVRLKIGTDSGVTTGIQYTSAVTPDSEGLALHNWTGLGLTAGQRYYYRVMMTDSLSAEIADTESTVGTFKVAPTGQASFNFCFAGCTQEGPDSAAMAAVAARGDDFFLHLGDMYYADASGTGIANFRAKIDEKLSVANHKAVFATMGMSYCASDHDGGMNNNYVGAGDATARDNFNAAHRERFPNPLVPTTTGTYHAWSWGRIRFVHTDERSFKSLNADTDNSSKTILGATQKQWLKDEITNATEQVIVWIGDTPWTGATSAGQDHWAGYNTERTEMANFITASGKHVARLGSDMHAVAADDGTNSAAGIPVFHGGPLNNNASIKGNPYSHGPYPASGTAIVEQYGRIVVTDSGSQISFAFTGYSADNTARVTYTKNFTLGTSSSASGTASLSLGASGTVNGAGSSSTASLTFTASGGTQAPGSAAASLTLAAAGTAQAAASSSAASLTLAAAGGAQAPSSSTAALSLNATGTAVSQSSAVGTASIALSGAGTARSAAGAAALLSLSASGQSQAAVQGGAASLTLTAAGGAGYATSGSGSLALAATGTAAASQTSTAALSLSATGTARASAQSTASLTFSASGGGGASTAANASITISAAGAGTTQASSTASLSLAASGTARAAVGAGTGSISLSATGTALAQGSTTGNASITLSATGSASAGSLAGSASIALTASAQATARAAGAGSLSLSGGGTSRAALMGAASIILSGTGSARGQASGTGSLSLSATGTARGSSASSANLELFALNSAAAAAVAGQASVVFSSSAAGRGTVAGAAEVELFAEASQPLSVAVAGSAYLDLTGFGKTTGDVDITIFVGVTRMAGIDVDVMPSRASSDTVGATRGNGSVVGTTRRGSVLIGDNRKNIEVGPTRRDRAT